MNRTLQKGVPARPVRSSRWRLLAPGRILVYVYLILLYLPIYWMITMAFKRRVDIVTTTPKLVFEPVLENFTYLFARGAVQESIVRSLWVALLAVGLSLILGSACAYALARFRWFRQQDIEFFIVSTRMLPPVAVILPFYAIFIRFQLLDNIVALAVVYLLIDLPLVIWLLLGFFAPYLANLTTLPESTVATRLPLFGISIFHSSKAVSQQLRCWPFCLLGASFSSLSF